MKADIVQTSQGVTLVGAGQASKGDLDIALAFAPYLVAADGGAQLALNCGRAPKKIIGDFDSIDANTLAQIPKTHQHRIEDQNTTDFEKCLCNISAPFILGVGFLGGRLDHQLSAFNALVRHRGPSCILLGETDLIFHLHGEIELPLEPGTRISLFPMTRMPGASQGLVWPIDSLDLSPDSHVSVSNAVGSNPVHLNFPDPGMLVILPKAALSLVIAALRAP